jgi:hypothetical protein
MKRMRILQSIIGLLAALTAKAQVLEMSCPDGDLHETSIDCPWAGVSRSLEGVTDPLEIRETFEFQIPGFLRQLEADTRSRQLLHLWGLSRNMDESNLTVKTVPVNLIAYFNSILKVDYDDTFSVGHAGLNHTYGYLFSQVYTPFGYKRARYVQGEIEAGFGLPDNTFGGVANKGTLLGNMTYFAGKIAFRDADAKLSASTLQAILDQKEITLSDELRAFDFSKAKVRRLVETIDSEKVYLQLRTDIVEFPNKQTRGTNEALLIYSIDFHAPGQEKQPRLITAFPVAKSFGDALFTQEGIGTDKQIPLKLKYNAMLPVTIPAELMVGKRALYNEQSCN